MSPLKEQNDKMKRLIIHREIWLTKQCDEKRIGNRSNGMY